MLEPTHIINPTDTGLRLRIMTDMIGFYVELNHPDPYWPHEYLSGQSLPTEAQAVSQWNAMFSKAPYVAHKGEV